jgi:hypothetical protein
MACRRVPVTLLDVSYQMFVQRFEHGEAVPMPSAAFHAVFGPHVDRTEPEFHLWHVHASDGGEADLYATVTPESFGGFMISRFSAGVVLDLVVEFARQADAVILPPGCPALLAAETQRRQLPDEFQHEAVIVAHSRDIEDVFRAC